jgi:hypothetical protein
MMGGCVAPESADGASTPPHTVGHGVVLYLGTRVGDDCLALQGPGDEVVAQEHCITRGGPVSVRTTHPIDVSIDDELRCGGMVKKQTIVKSALEVVEDPLCNHEMGLLRVVHVEAHLLDRVGDVEPGEGEVLESPR